MGKAKNKDNFSFVIDIRAVLAMRPEQRVRWLAKACRKVADGEANVKHVYDVLSSRKLVVDMAEKVGRRMLRVLREHLYLFSEKQQRFLNEESALALQFSVDERSEEEPAEEADEAAASKQGGAKVDDAATRMEEMMARCRDFVRSKASTFEERQREAEEAELQARLERERQVAMRLAQEWDAIHKWHRQLEGWERAQMLAADELQQAWDLQAAAAAAEEQRRGRGRSRHASGSSRGESSDDARRSKKEKHKRRERERERGRRRRSSSSASSRGKEERRAQDKRQKLVDEDWRRTAEATSTQGSGSGRRFQEQDQQQAMEAMQKAQEVQRMLSQSRAPEPHQRPRHAEAMPASTLADLLRGNSGAPF